MADMAKCNQFNDWSILDHGIDCANRLLELLTAKNEHGQVNKWILPDWYWQFKSKLKIAIGLGDIYEYALFHDCGKPYCRIVDEKGRQHFPNHAEVSYRTYLNISNNQVVADLIKHDMDIHLLKPNDIGDFCKNQNASLHLLAGIAEIHSNAEHSGGFDTTNFKIKLKTINQRGKAIYNCLLKGNEHVKHKEECYGI